MAQAAPRGTIAGPRVTRETKILEFARGLTPDRSLPNEVYSAAYRSGEALKAFGGHGTMDWRVAG